MTANYLGSPVAPLFLLLGFNRGTQKETGQKGTTGEPSCSGFCIRLYGFTVQVLSIWEFPKIRGTVFWGPYNKDPAI